MEFQPTAAIASRSTSIAAIVALQGRRGRRRDPGAQLSRMSDGRLLARTLEENDIATVIMAARRTSSSASASRDFRFPISRLEIRRVGPAIPRRKRSRSIWLSTSSSPHRPREPPCNRRSSGATTQTGSSTTAISSVCRSRKSRAAAPNLTRARPRRSACAKRSVLVDEREKRRAEAPQLVLADSRNGPERVR